jgi:hypothetical protein
MPVSQQEIKKLVIARLQTMPPSMNVSLGSMGTFDREQLIEQVKKDTDIGEKIIEVHLNYLRSFAK